MGGRTDRTMRRPLPVRQPVIEPGALHTTGESMHGLCILYTISLARFEGKGGGTRKGVAWCGCTRYT